MLVLDVMNQQIAYITPDKNIAEAAQLLADHDCGVLPVIDKKTERVIGMVTDRDICMTIANNPERLSAEVPVRDAMTTIVFSCKPENSARVALESMKRHAIRRLPVVDQSEKLKGILSINDFILFAKGEHDPKRIGFSEKDVFDTLASISKETRGSLVKA
jgi:CBS-domain-containing membrane protein